MTHLSPARLAAAGLTTLAFVLPSAAHAAPCAPGGTGPAVDVVVARGSAEPSDGYSPLGLDGADGSLGKDSTTGVWTLIKNELTSPTDGSTPIAASDVVRSDVVYPASLPIPSTIEELSQLESQAFRESQTAGLIWVINHLNEACANTRFVLLGYSQGALVMNNVASTVGGRIQMAANMTVPTLNAGVTDRIAAISVFADAGRSASDNNTAKHVTTALTGSSVPGYLKDTFDDVNRGQNDGLIGTNGQTTVIDGFKPRPNPVTTLAGFKGRIRSYCITDDAICALQGGNVLSHVLYGTSGQKLARRNLAIFAIQKLRNRVDKTFVNAQCAFTGATNQAVMPWSFSLTLRLQAVVADRATPGAYNKTNQIKASLNFNYNQASLLQAALGSPSAIKRVSIGLPLESETTTPSGTTLWEEKTVVSVNDSLIPLGNGFDVGLPGGTYASTVKSADWTIVTPGYNDLRVGNEFTVAFSGQGGGYAFLDCNLSDQASAAFGGRHFGRVVIAS